MKLFISWSGEFSKKVAECLSLWIPTIIQTVDVFYSPDDIAKGENWSSRLSDELEQSDFGIVCLTPENILAPWIHFEAGALSKVARSRVSAIMLGISPSDVKGPLARFQNTAFTREDFHRLFLSINNSQEVPLKQTVLDHAFDNSWEKLMNDIGSIVKHYASRTPSPKSEKIKTEKHNSDNDAIQELLRLARNIDNQLQFVRNVDNGRNMPPQESASSSTSNFGYDSKLVVLHCPEKYVGKALPVIREYTGSPPSIIRDVEQDLRTNGKCIIFIPSNQLTQFEFEMKAFAPEAKIVS